MSTIFTLDFIDQKVMDNIEDCGVPDDTYFDRVIPLLDTHELTPPKKCIDHVLSFAASYVVLEKKDDVKIELLLN